MKANHFIAKSGEVSHHAFFLETSNSLPEVLSFIGKSLGVKMRGNPDVSVIEVETFGIDEARALQEAQSRRGWSSDRKVFVVSAFQLTHEAQNALLKVFEEPTLGTIFFLVTPSFESLLPTLRSRLEVARLGGKGVLSAKQPAHEFLESKTAKRLKFLRPIIENKDKGRALKLLDGLEEILHSEGRANLLPHLEDLVKFRGYLQDRSPSLKILLEHLAVTLPVL